jgi:hypothetical protein
MIIFFMVFLFSPPSLAFAETATVGLEVTPRSGSTLYKNAFTPANWRIETLITSDRSTIYPMIEADLQLPSPDIAFSKSSSAKVCPDNKINANSNILPITEMVSRCPDAVIGHGTAKFALNRVNSDATIRDGYMVIFNGGLVGGRPRIKITAYSYETSAGVYTEGILQSNGRIRFLVPPLSSDSAVVSLNLEIPSKSKRVFIENQGYYITLPGGRDPNYVRAKCSNGTLPFAGNFLLGARTQSGIIIESINVLANSTTACLGKTGAARMAISSLKGPGSAKRGKKATYTVVVRNTGASNAAGALLRISGKGVSAKKKLPSLMPATGMSVRIPLTFKSKGKIRVTFKASAKGAKASSKAKTVRVR